MMLYEDQIMDSTATTTSCSPTKKGHNNSLNSSASSNSFEVKPLRCSWAEEVLRVEYDTQKDNTQKTVSRIEEDNNGCEKSQSREISLEFIDGANEEKFERLVKEDKLKTPFKRRHSATHSNDDSGKSRSNSPNSSNSEGGDAKNNQKRYFDNHKEEKKRLRHNSYTSASSSSSSYTETDPAVLSRRQKQIDYGKNTVAYERYIETVPRAKRTRDHPHTPDKYGKYSRRAFDGLVKIWRKQLHYYDPPNAKPANAENDSSDDSDSD